MKYLIIILLFASCTAYKTTLKGEAALKNQTGLYVSDIKIKNKSYHYILKPFVPGSQLTYVMYNDNLLYSVGDTVTRDRGGNIVYVYKK